MTIAVSRQKREWETMRVLLVRHGHAGSKKAWSGDDRLRPLDGLGRRQAQALARSLGKLKPTRIVSSPYARCVQTVEPLAAKLGLQVEHSPHLGPDAGPAALDFIHGPTAGPATAIVLCTHREVLELVLPALSAQFGVPLGHRRPGAKGSTWLLEFRRERLVAVHYQPSPK